ncbi:hypothetical protein ADUPG1_011367 [Aduncisulcus paluster]|uniref:Uncharacterized protein n=1 Tax=Aduncisulcus paluster TaxID=2918883 RepID=A0ABQ5JVK9_9EUKA|nr:hypothetical protein ADUPG1_011367 [Aduncisulcus paluster]
MQSFRSALHNISDLPPLASASPTQSYAFSPTPTDTLSSFPVLDKKIEKEDGDREQELDVVEEYEDPIPPAIDLEQSLDQYVQSEDSILEIPYDFDPIHLTSKPSLLDQVVSGGSHNYLPYEQPKMMVIVGDHASDQSELSLSSSHGDNVVSVLPSMSTSFQQYIDDSGLIDSSMLDIDTQEQSQSGKKLKIVIVVFLILCSFVGSCFFTECQKTILKISPLLFMFANESIGFIFMLPILVISSCIHTKKSLLYGDFRDVSSSNLSSLVFMVALLSVTHVVMSYSMALILSESVSLFPFIVSLGPIITFISSFFLRHEHVSNRLFLCVFLVIFGIILSVVSFGLRIPLNLVGFIVFYFISSSLYFIYSPIVFLKLSRSSVSPVKVLFWVYFLSVVMSIFIVVVFARSIFVQIFSSVDLFDWCSIVFVGLFGALISILCAYAIRIFRSPIFVHSFSILYIIFSCIIGLIFYGDEISWAVASTVGLIVGLCIILGGTILLIVSQGIYLATEEYSLKEPPIPLNENLFSQNNRCDCCVEQQKAPKVEEKGQENSITSEYFSGFTPRSPLGNNNNNNTGSGLRQCQANETPGDTPGDTPGETPGETTPAGSMGSGAVTPKEEEIC